ncbi:hypothetical protein COJ01_17525 [Priestia megaterium]|uniref:hypothetical protein n=1 Tax=Priestia megaterium TaxID=1404 RepID=UPI000BF49DC2|nr:hypothetical protein [Priestia megaterium]PFK99864.1 hypothetical protein COJ01_17525 [Priestia megaterium]
MPAYIRLIIGDKGKVIKVIEDSLYDPDDQQKDFIEELLKWGGSSIDYVDEHINDSEVLIVFRPHSYQCNHPLDPVEYDTDMIIDHTIILQPNYKEHWRKQILQQMEFLSGCKDSQETVQHMVGEWEEIYDRDFYQTQEIKGVIIDNTQFGLGLQYLSFEKTEGENNA